MDTYADGNGPIDYAPYQQAIQSIESGGNYGALGPVTAKGDRAYGAYQVMGANVPDWTAKHYGQSLTPDEFLKNKEAQDAVFKGEFGSALQKHGNPQDAASVWFSGRPLAQAGNASDGYNTTHQYVSKFNKALGGTGALALAADDDEEDPVTKLQNSGALATNNVVGPGALTPQRLMTAPKEDDRLQKVAQGVTGIGAALAGISSPQQAYALNQQLQTMKKDNESKYKTMVTKDGRILRIDQDGNIDSVGGNPAANDPNAQAPQMLPVWGNTKLLGDDASKITPDQKEAYLKSMVGGQGEMVRSLLENRMAPPTAAAMSRKDSPYPAAFAAAAKLDPTLDPTVYAARIAGQRDWATKGAESARALNQTISHQSNVLIDAMKGLDNFQSPMANKIKNVWGEYVTGSGAVPGFRTSAHAVVDELGKVFKQNNLSDTEIRKWEENLPDTMSPEQQRTQIAAFHKLMGGAMDALEGKRKQAIGDWAAAKQRPLLSEEGSAGLKALDAFASSGPNAFNKQPAAAASPAGVNTFKTPTGKTVNWSVN